MSNRGDNMSKANLQANGLAEKPTHGAADQQEMEEEDSSPITCQCCPLSRGHLPAISIQTTV